MAWSRYDVLIHLGTGNVWKHTDIPYHLGVVKARTKDEAENKGVRIAQLQGLCGVIEVKRIIAPN